MRICVYGASSTATAKDFLDAGIKLGNLIAEKGHSLIFGGGVNGMMGAVAEGVHEKNGKIIGVAPRFFNADDVLFPHCDELIRCDTMRQRKQLMDDGADAFVVTAGGIGTFEEFFEILTLRQLGQSSKPIAILNTNGYYNKMFDMFKAAIENNFMHDKTLSLFGISKTPEEALSYIENYRMGAYGKISDYKGL